MTATKTIVTAGTMATALLFGGIFLYMNFGSIAKSFTEKIASQTLGVSVNIGHMDVSLPEKRVTVGNVRIGNPGGFDTNHSVMLKKVEVALDGITEELITINRIVVNGSDINAEFKEGGANLDKIRKHAKAHAPKKDPNAPQRKVIIKRFEMDGAAIHPVIKQVGDNLPDVNLPPLTMTGIGQKTNGVLASEAISQIWSHVSQKATQTALQSGVLDNLSSEALNKLGVETGGLKDQILDDVGSGLKGLLGR